LASAGETTAPAVREDVAAARVRPADVASLVAWIALVAVVTILYWPTVASILSRWTTDPTYSHGWLILAISAWMSWRAWKHGEFGPVRPAYYALVPLLGAGLVWLLARSASINVVQQLAIPAILLGGAWVLFGWRGLRALMVPVGVLYFVMPAWDYARPVLQDLTVDATGVVLESLGVAAFIHGYRVDLAVGSFIVVEGCSGLHFFMAAGALATIQAHLYIRRRWAQAVLIGAALTVALVANWIRVAAVVYAGHVTEMQSFLIEDHYYFGWVVFMLMMIPVFYLGHRLETDSGTNPPAGAAPDAGSAEPRTLATGLAAALAGVALAPLAWWGTFALAGPAVNPPYLPAQVGSWTLAGEASPDWQPLQPGSDLQLGGHYTYGDQALDAWIIYYERQGPRGKLFGYGQSMARPDDGRLLPGDAGPGELRLMSPWSGMRLIRYRYEIAGRVAVTDGRARLYQSIGNLGGDPEAYGLVISARCRDESCAGAREMLENFAEALGSRVPRVSDVERREGLVRGEGE
jgi:exosortase A